MMFAAVDVSNEEWYGFWKSFSCTRFESCCACYARVHARRTALPACVNRIDVGTLIWARSSPVIRQARVPRHTRGVATD